MVDTVPTVSNEQTDSAGTDTKKTPSVNPVPAKPEKPPAPKGPVISDLPDEQITSMIKSYLAGKDISQTPCFVANAGLFPGQKLTNRFEMLFRSYIASITKPDDGKSAK